MMKKFEVTLPLAKGRRIAVIMMATSITEVENKRNRIWDDRFVPATSTPWHQVNEGRKEN